MQPSLFGSLETFAARCCGLIAISLAASSCLLVVDFDYGGSAGGGGSTSSSGASTIGGGGIGEQGGGGAPLGGGGAGGCGDVTSDAMNCGGCGHACEVASACVDSLCTPVALALSASGSPGQALLVAIDGDHAFVALDTDMTDAISSHIVRVDLTTMAQDAESGVVITTPSVGLSAGGGKVFTSQQQPGLTICSQTLVSCPVYGPADEVNGVAYGPDTGLAYFIVPFGTATGLYTSDTNGNQNQVWIDSLAASPPPGYGVAVRNDRVAVSIFSGLPGRTDGAICRGSIEEAANLVCDVAAETPQGIVLLDDGTIYFHDQLGPIARVKPSATIPEYFQVSGRGLAADDRFVYTATDAGLEFCATGNDCTAITLFPAIPELTSGGIALTDDDVYFTAGSSLYRVRKPAPELAP